MSAVLAIDYGRRRVGLAVTDKERRFVFPRETLLRSTKERDLAYLAELCREVEAGLVVLGLPLNSDGSEGPMAAEVRAFGALVEEQLGLPLVYVDERYSSQEADEKLHLRGRRRRRQRGQRDRAAAAIILQSFLDHGPFDGPS